MNTAKIYHDSNDDECTIFQMLKREPEWSANRIQEGEKAIEQLQKLVAVIDEVIKTSQPVGPIQGVFVNSNKAWQGLMEAWQLHKANGI